MELPAVLCAAFIVSSTFAFPIDAEYQTQGPLCNSVFDVRDFGAKGDGVTNDWHAVNAALQAAAFASRAGSTVSVLLPGAAVYLVDKPLVLNASNMLVWIETGAILRWHWDRDLDFLNQWPRTNDRFATMINTASNQQLRNISLGGGGTIDGQGFMWWPFFYHVYEFMTREHWPPYFLQFSSVQNLELFNLTILDPPMITIQTCSCSHVHMHHINISASWLTPDEFYSPQHSPKFGEWRRTAPVTSGGTGKNGTCGSPGLVGGRIWADRPHDPRCEPVNTDGIDPGCGSRDIHIHDIFIENGDDSIVMKPGWPQPGMAAPEGCTRNVLVERVTIRRGMGINIGGMGSGCVDNITFRDVLLDHPSLCGAEIKTENGRDNRSFVSNVLYDNITFRRSLNATGFPCVSITAAYRGDGHGYAGPYLPKISNISFMNVDMRGCATPVTVRCNASAPCEGVVFDNIRTDEEFVCEHVNCFAENVTKDRARQCCSTHKNVF